jgi:hypothetical protein
MGLFGKNAVSTMKDMGWGKFDRGMFERGVKPETPFPIPLTIVPLSLPVFLPLEREGTNSYAANA